MNFRRILLAGVLALFTLGACATPGTLASAPLSAQQADLLSQWQGFSGRVLDSYHLAHVRLIVQPRPDNQGVMVTSVSARVIIIDPRTLDPRMIVGLAHEIGHVVSGRPHDPGHQEANELDANFRAVAILVIGDGVSEETAFRQMHALLAAIATVRAKMGTRAPAFHNACAEVADLDRHFPQYPVPSVLACEAAR